MGFWASLLRPAPVASAAWLPWSLGSSSTDGLEAGAGARRLSAFRPGSRHVNTLVANAGRTVIERARWLTRNNGYAVNAVEWFGSTVVGSGITPSWLLEDNPALKTALRQAWDEWTDEADAEGLTDFYGMQRRAARELMIAGEVFLRIRYRLPEDGLSVPMQLQMLPSEMLDASFTTRLPNGNMVRQGVEFSPIGARVAYWFWRQHPGDTTADQLWKVERSRVPAAEVIHLIDPIEAGQIRGLSRFANVTVKLFTLDQYDDAELERKKTAALFAGFIKRAAADDELPIEALAGVAPGLQAGSDTAIAGLEAGTMQALNPGEEVEFSEPADVGGNFEAFQYRTLLQIGAGLGVPYFALTGDMVKANYASSRAEQVSTKRRIDAYQWSVMIFGMCRPVVSAWVRQAALARAVPGFDADTLLAAPRRYQRVRWMTPPWLWVDPLKDMQADKMAVDNGFKSRSDVVEGMGYDAAETDRRIAADREREAKLGLVFPGPKERDVPAADPPAETPPAEKPPE